MSPIHVDAATMPMEYTAYLTAAITLADFIVVNTRLENHNLSTMSNNYTMQHLHLTSFTPPWTLVSTKTTKAFVAMPYNTKALRSAPDAYSTRSHINNTYMHVHSN